MPAPGFQLLTDLPNFLKVFPKEVTKATVAGQQEGVTTWRDNPAFPGLAHRFTWPGSKSYTFSMRRSMSQRISCAAAAPMRARSCLACSTAVNTLSAAWKFWLATSSSRPRAPGSARAERCSRGNASS